MIASSIFMLMTVAAFAIMEILDVRGVAGITKSLGLVTLAMSSITVALLLIKLAMTITEFNKSLDD